MVTHPALGNGAREAIVKVVAEDQGMFVLTPELQEEIYREVDYLLACLWEHGFKVVPLDGSE